MNLAALTTPHKIMVLFITLVLSASISTHSHANNTRVDISRLHYTMGSTKLDITANVPTEYTLEGETEAVELSEISIIQQQQKYYTLGGVRLKFTLPENTLEGAEITANPKFEWKIGAAGKLCTDFTYTAAGTECETLTADTVFDKTHAKLKTDYEFYWEPEKWDNTLDAQGTLTITFDNEDLPKKEIAFKLEKRELKATAVTGPVPAEALEGDDVAMLESMLWHLGISPQKGTDYQGESNAGSQGNRINSTRSAALGKTVNCDGSNATVRNIFSAGWNSCGDGKVAIEGMIRRFKGRHISADETNKFARSSGATVTGVVDENMLTDLEYAWSQYIEAVQSNPTALITINHASVDGWLTSAIKIWDEGLGSSVPITYTKTKHDKVLELAGVNGEQYNRKALLKAWKARETKSHWGHGYPQTEYRMTEGGGDELGSMSFNQIQYHYRYSKKPIRVHKEKALNYFDPADNIKGFIIHTAANAGGNTSVDYGHKGAFYKVFSQGTARNHNESDLKAYQHCNSAGVCSAVSAITANEDEYEQLARAIAEYNINPGSKSWPLTLKNKKLADCRSCEYSIDVRNSSDKFNLPYRAYIWKGGNYPADLTDEAGNPDPKAGTEWCFKYGEEEWVDGKLFEDIKVAADRYDEEGDVKTQIGAINCSTGNSI